MKRLSIFVLVMTYINFAEGIVANVGDHGASQSQPTGQLKAVQSKNKEVALSLTGHIFKIGDEYRLAFSGSRKSVLIKHLPELSDTLEQYTGHEVTVKGLLLKKYEDGSIVMQAKKIVPKYAVAPSNKVKYEITFPQSGVTWSTKYLDLTATMAFTLPGSSIEVHEVETPNGTRVPFPWMTIELDQPMTFDQARQLAKQFPDMQVGNVGIEAFALSLESRQAAVQTSGVFEP